MKSRLNVIFGLFMIAGLLLAACQPQAQATQQPPQEVIKEVVVTDTIPLSERALSCTRIKALSVSGLLSEAVRRIYYNDSVSSLFI